MCNIATVLLMCVFVMTSSMTQHLRGFQQTTENNRYGELQMIQCPNGKNATCHKGTFGCTSNSSTFCNHYSNAFGHMKHIHCGQKSVTCPSGVQDCYDDSATFCNITGKAMHIFCGNDTSSIICYAGTFGCYNHSVMYCH